MGNDGEVLSLPSARAFWGKSDVQGSPLLLIQHLLDTAAVGDILWDRVLPRSLRRTWDDSGGCGRDVFVLLCGLHDVGKATPAFQSKAPQLCESLHREGLNWRRLSPHEESWHHTLAGARLLVDNLPSFGWEPAALQGWWPFIAGHHGKVPAAVRLRYPGLGECHGRGEIWRRAQSDLIRTVACQLDIDLRAVAKARFPNVSGQLALLGALVMADWIASNDQHFPAVDSLTDVGIELARRRADAGVTALGLRGGWAERSLGARGDLVRNRFGLTARPLQQMVVEVAQSATGPRLLVIEAPMGEGKTEAALAAAEVLARTCGCDGVFVGMPSQATSDPMFARVRRWAEHVDPSVPVALLHGKARFNPEWRRLIESRPSVVGVDEFGCEDLYGVAAEADVRSGQVPAEWLLGRKRGLLTPVAVGTVDQLLYAATRTRHVMLRHAGLVGKVVVLDEVHAYDVYMSQFLHEALRWLAAAGVPVVLLSATLPPATRDQLVTAYLQGALAVRDVEPVSSAVGKGGYPQVLSAGVTEGKPVLEVRTSDTWRVPLQVAVDVLEEPPGDTGEAVAQLLVERLAEGGCALVIRNTVKRAQDTYEACRELLGGDVVLLHARLTAAVRADRTADVLAALGAADDKVARPRRMVVVATQLAEQSFDLDADLLVSDLAPVDLLLQRVGRLHRHDRPAGARPGPVRTPRLVVTGVRGGDHTAPWFPSGSKVVYGDRLLLRAAQLVREATADHRGWVVPTDVPSLVERGYAEHADLPDKWARAATAAETAWRQSQARRKAEAEQFLLLGPDGLGAPTLAGLHDRPVGDVDEEEVSAFVRDGEPSVEVVLVRRNDRGYLSLDGHHLGPTGAAVSDPEVLERVLGDLVRLPARADLTAAAEAQLTALPGWAGDSWLARVRALVLDDAGTARLGNWVLRYDDEIGLITERER